MALEDRCSPQTAPSPHGLQQPHSPHSTISPSLLEIHHHQQQQNFIAYQHHHSQQFQQKMSPLLNSSYASSDRLTPQSDGNITIKEEVDSIMSDNDHEDQIPVHHIQPSPPPAPLPRISFSITNILSDRFGRETETQQQQQANVTKSKKTPLGIFRPFENGEKNNTEEKSAFTRVTSPPTNHHHIAPAVNIIDFSRRQQIALQQIAAQQPQHLTHHQAAAAAAAAVMMAERASFLNCFNPASYPRIHEEILNSTARKYKQSAEKIPPLGSLHKAVSQIGQTASIDCISSPPPASISSTSASPALSSVNGSSCSSNTSNNSRLPNSSPQPIPPQSASRDSGMESSDDTRSESGSTKDADGNALWPAWVYCTRYSDRPSSGPRYRRPKKPKDPKDPVDEKRPRTAFSSDQLARLKREFNENRYLTERRRQQLSSELGLNEAQIKIWFQNKRAKIKKTCGSKNPLALQLMAQGLYNHSTVPLTKEEEELEMRMNGQL